VTERRTAELAAQRLAAIVNGSEDAIIGKDLNGIITNWNEGARRIFGYEAKEIVGRSILTLVPPELRGEESDILGRLRKGQRIEHFETVRVTKDGRSIEVSITVSPIRDADGLVIGASKIARDVTERRRVERALAEAQKELQVHATDLEARVEERTKTLQKTVAELEAFSYSLSHDLRAPLRAIQSFLQIFVEDYGARMDEAALAIVHKVILAARRMDTMVLDLLAFTRLSHETIPIEPVDTEKLLQRIIEERSDFRAPQAQITLHSPLAKVMGNEASLTQCLTNLLDNAVKFVAPGVKPAIEIHTQRSDSMVTLWVEDNGIGISQEEQGRLFRMFHRAHGKIYPGTGIGLAIVRKAAERMGGSAGMESEPNQGSRFWLQLPGAAP
jgi:PAS domain S-box-containing protein